MIRHTVAICTAGRTEVFRRTVHELRDKLTHDQVTEVLVVNNGPASDTPVLREYARQALGSTRARLRIIHEPEAGVARARNRVLQEAGGELITMLDDDVSPVPADWQSQILDLFAAHPEVGLSGGPAILQVPEGCKQRPWWRSERTDEAMSCLKGPETGPCLPGQVFGLNVTYRRKAVEGLRFHEKLGWNVKAKMPFAGEETLIHERICRNGWTAWFDRRIAVHHRIHPGQYTVKWLLRRAYIGGRTAFFFDEAFRDERWSSRRQEMEKLLLSVAKLAVRACQGKGAHAFTHLRRIAHALGYLFIAAQYAWSRRLRGEFADARSSERHHARV